VNTKPLGRAGENYAEKLLIKNDYSIVERNFKCKTGEIDIIALKDNVLVFVEVKTRNSSKFGLPEEAVTKRKLYKIRKSGEWYILQNPNLPKKQRIDVVSILLYDNKVVREKIIKVT
jgi:putative endonuclease